MNGYAKAVVIFMVLLLLLSAVFGYKTDTFGDAIKGFEGTLSFVGTVGETTLDVVSAVGGAFSSFGEAFKYATSETDYVLPWMYQVRCGEANMLISEIDYCAFTQSQNEALKRCYSVLGLEADIPRVIECSRNTALAMYWHDMYAVLEQNNGDYEAYRRIEFKPSSADIVLRLKWFFTHSKICESYLPKWTSADFFFNPSLEVMVMKYEFGKDYKLDANGNLVEGVSSEWIKLNEK